ncbi:MAG: L,D-transpeptidase [Bacillota bacterium]
MSKLYIIKRTMKLSGILLLVLAALFYLWGHQGNLLAVFLRDSMTDEPHRPLSEIVIDRKISKPRIIVSKRQKTLIVFDGDRLLKTYTVSLGTNPSLDAKIKDKDNLTPEGTYYVVEKTSFGTPRRFLGSRWLGLNYPNFEDAKRGFKEGLITSKDFLAIEKAALEHVPPPKDTPLGGIIGIHGGGSPLLGSSWTNGSIGMYNKDVEELFEYIPLGTEVLIKK